MNITFQKSISINPKSSNLLVSRGRPSLLTLRGMTAPLSSRSADRVFPTELPRLIARLGVWGCGEAVSDCWGLLDTEIYTLSLHDALPISSATCCCYCGRGTCTRRSHYRCCYPCNLIRASDRALNSPYKQEEEHFVWESSAVYVCVSKVHMTYVIFLFFFAWIRRLEIESDKSEGLHAVVFYLVS